MAYDEGLAQRIREQLTDRSGIVEKKMFGGLAFLLRGNMCVGVIGDDMIVRVGPDAYDAAMTRPGARVFDFSGKPSKGMVTVGGDGTEDDDALRAWIEAGLAFAGSLPAKSAAAPSKRTGRKR
jgi:hypothetical protein